MTKVAPKPARAKARTELEALIAEHEKDKRATTVRRGSRSLDAKPRGGGRTLHETVDAEAPRDAPSRRVNAGDVPTGMEFWEDGGVLLKEPTRGPDGKIILPYYDPASPAETDYWKSKLDGVIHLLIGLRYEMTSGLRSQPFRHRRKAIEAFHAAAFWRPHLESLFDEAAIARKERELLAARKRDPTTSTRPLRRGADILALLAKQWSPLPKGLTATVIDALLPLLKTGSRGGGRPRGDGGGTLSAAKAAEAAELAAIDHDAFKVWLEQRRAQRDGRRRRRKA